MNTFRIALANIRYPESPEDSVALAQEAIAEASRAGAGIICFPECYVPGYPRGGNFAGRPDRAFLENACAQVAGAAGRAKVAAILGTERFADQGRLLTAVVMNPDGSIAGFQDKVQLDPSEDATYAVGSGRRIFQTGALTFGIAICHEGWRYPETVRWAAEQGAQVVFHPHFHEPEPGGYVPASFGDPANTFHEKAVLCRAAENTCYFASVNAMTPDAPTTSAIAWPDGTLFCHQPYGKDGLLVADLDLDRATGLLAKRRRAVVALR